MALLLRNRGVKRIRPLQGGLGAWRDRGYPLTAVSRELIVKGVAGSGFR